MAKLMENAQAPQPAAEKAPRTAASAKKSAKKTEAAAQMPPDASQATAAAEAVAAPAKKPAPEACKAALRKFGAKCGELVHTISKNCAAYSARRAAASKAAPAGQPGKKGRAPKGKNKGSLVTGIRRGMIAAILVVACCVLLVLITTSTAAARSVASSAASTSMKVMEQQCQAEGTLLSSNCTALAGDDHVVDLLSGQAETINDTNWKTYCLFRSYYNAVLIDKDGKVLASGVSCYTKGTDLSGNGAVAAVLEKGEPVYQMQSEDAYPYVMEAAAPIIVSSKTAGAIMMLRDFTDKAFVDDLKEMTGDEYTIFAGNVRINTTLTDKSGERLLDTEMDPEIAQKVLEQGETYNCRLKINGTEYLTIYQPVQNLKGEITGAMFTGYNLAAYSSSMYRSIFLSIFLVAGLIVLEISILRVVLNRHLSQPLDAIVLSVNEIADGRMDEQTSARLAALQNKNETGQLARAMERAVASVRALADDTQALQDALKRNDLTAVVDVEKYAGIYRSIAEILNQLFAEIALNMKQIRQVSMGINDRTCQVSSAAESLAQGSTEQASSVEELASTISQIVSRVNQNAEDAQNASSVSQAAAEDVSQSSEQMTSMLHAMNEISETSAQIGSIVKTIDDLAFQTSILALNAAVEAAHAGSQGRGFAVVANEVKSLASKSAAAAKDSAELIENVQKAILKGSEHADSVEQSLQNMIGNTEKVNKVVLEISAAASEQVNMLEQISSGVEQISAVVQSNTGIAEETAATSQGLTLDTEKLNEMVNKYKFT